MGLELRPTGDGGDLYYDGLYVGSITLDSDRDLSFRDIEMVARGVTVEGPDRMFVFTTSIGASGNEKVTGGDAADYQGSGDLSLRGDDIFMGDMRVGSISMTADNDYGYRNLEFVVRGVSVEGPDRMYVFMASIASGMAERMSLDEYESTTGAKLSSRTAVSVGDRVEYVGPAAYSRVKPGTQGTVTRVDSEPVPLGGDLGNIEVPVAVDFDTPAGPPHFLPILADEKDLKVVGSRVADGPRRTENSGLYELDHPDGVITIAKDVAMNGTAPSWGYTDPGSPDISEYGFGTLSEAADHARQKHGYRVAENTKCVCGCPLSEGGTYCSETCRKEDGGKRDKESSRTAGYDWSDEGDGHWFVANGTYSIDPNNILNVFDNGDGTWGWSYDQIGPEGDPYPIFPPPGQHAHLPTADEAMWDAEQWYSTNMDQAGKLGRTAGTSIVGDLRQVISDLQSFDPTELSDARDLIADVVSDLEMILDDYQRDIDTPNPYARDYRANKTAGFLYVVMDDHEQAEEAATELNSLDCWGGGRSLKIPVDDRMEAESLAETLEDEGFEFTDLSGNQWFFSEDDITQPV